MHGSHLHQSPVLHVTPDFRVGIIFDDDQILTEIGLIGKLMSSKQEVISRPLLVRPALNLPWEQVHVCKIVHRALSAPELVWLEDTPTPEKPESTQ